MEKKKRNRRGVFCDYAHYNEVTDLQDGTPDKHYYINSLAYYSSVIMNLAQLEGERKYADETVQEFVDDIIIWALSTYCKYEYRQVGEDYFMDVEAEDLPANMNKEDFMRFKKAMKIVVEHYQGICYGLGKPSIIWMKDFKPFFARTEKYIVEMPSTFFKYI